MIGTKKKIYTRKLSCQFLLGTVQLAVAKVTEYMEELGWEIVSIPLRYGTTVFKQERFDVEYIRKCQFLLGTVQREVTK